MGRGTRTFGGLAAAAVCLAIVPLLLAGAATARTLYVGGTKAYSIAFKTEAGRHYVVQLAGTAHCHFTEPRENVGPTSFSMFPAPAPMRKRQGGYVGGAATYDEFGGGSARVLANFARNRVTGTFGYDFSEESFHCETRHKVTFAAWRYVPADSRSAGAPIPHLAKTYYGKQSSIETYLAVRGDAVGGIRGDYVSRCPVGRGGPTGAAHRLFGGPAAVKRGEHGHFRVRENAEGRTGSGARFKESFALSGGVGHDEIVGTYRRVRTTTRKHRRVERCVTGPLPFRAGRYVPAR